MKITVVNNQNPLVTVVNLANPVIKIYLTGTQGIPGPPKSEVIDDTSSSITITTQNYLILKGPDALIIGLKDLNAIPVEILNAGGQSSIIRAPTGKLIFYNGQTDQDFIIPPGSVYSFVPKGNVYYAS